MDTQKFIKTLDELPEGYVQKLHDYLLENCDEFFNNSNNKACSEEDFERFPGKQTDRTHLVKYGELLLIDLDDKETGVDLGYRFQMGHCYFICSIPRGKKRRVTKIHRVISIRDELDNKHWRNGYFLLPVLP